MTKIYEALERAARQRDRGCDESKQAPASRPPDATMPVLPHSLEEKFIALYQAIESRSKPVGSGRFVEFVGVRHSESSSRLVYQFAKFVAFRLRKRVLLMAAGPYPQIRGIFTGEGPCQWEEVLEEGKLHGQVNHPVAETGAANTALSLVSATDLNMPLADTLQARENLDALRQRFDLLLVDAPPLPQSLNAGFISTLTDGAILVVDSERIRWQVVRHAIDQIRSQNGEVLGILLNRKRHYIPDFIYRRL